ncbi:tetratricopeptide repeat protein [Sphingobacterium sp. BIGb0116]|uniref:tetratricopeptide repeat protein n=1 Tax=Sphingobacterium sp. BIGb0116 TaxID=2940619 RepID=UPI002168A386|nr:tetratricopeptide repeat protein [Sphingobacterium sp. BIGb0116]MCS4165011.1 Flp pilus assembly protein TadD [Sphingobacterium sp. BIGb0116]
MFKKFTYASLFIGISGALLLANPSYAQRAGTTIERNKDANEINELYSQGKWEEGKKKVDEFLKKNPKDSDMRMLLGKYYLHRQQYDKARYELVKSLEYAPANVESKHMLVAVETETQRYSSAICYINELLEVNPYWKGLWRKKIELYRTMGNQVEADRLLKRIAQIYPEDTELKSDQNYLLEKRSAEIKKSGKLDQSIEMGKKLVEDQPRKQDSYFSIIDNYIKAGDFNNALVYTERALNQFPRDAAFVQKKIAILEHQQRYPEILTFLDDQLKHGGSGSLRSQYNYFLLEAARNAKNNDPASLYGKIFDGAPGNKEAFDYVYNDLIAKEQYEGAIVALTKHRRSVGGSKELDMRELTVYKRMGSQAKVSTLTKTYFAKYPGDTDLRESYVTLTLQQAKTSFQDGKIGVAISDWKDVIRYGDDASIAIAQQGLYNAYVTEGRYQEAIVVLDDILLDEPGDATLLLKKSDLYNKQGRYDQALLIYEQVLGRANEEERQRLLSGYSDIMIPRVKNLLEAYKLTEAQQSVDRWLTVDQYNQDALLYMINICYQLKDNDAMLRYAQIAEGQYADDVAFKIKLAEAMTHKVEKLADSWALLHSQVKLNPFHIPLVNTFTNTTEEYAGRLLKGKEHEMALNVIDTALHYKDNKVLKYMKGLAYEGLRNYDSAYYYQKFYEPSLLELDDFKSHLNYLGQKSFHNTVSVSHLRARFGDDYAISTISTIDYTRLNADGSTYTGRVNYAGRAEGKGVQGQFEWARPWTADLSSRMDVAWANKYFAKIALNAAAIYTWKPSWEAEAGLGFRSFYTKQNLFNLNLGISKEIEDFRLNAKLSNFYLNSAGQGRYLYSLMGKAQYFMNSPKNYVLAMGSIGNSPDIDLLDNQFYNSFNFFNAMVGAGLGRSISRNIGVSAIGTWYNFQTGKELDNSTYRNLYNLYLQLNVSF